MRVFRGEKALQILDPVLEDIDIGLRDNGKPVFVIADKKGPLLKNEPQILIFEDIPVLVSEDRDENLVPEFPFNRVPVDIKEIRIDRTRPVLEQIHPPEILLAGDAHMVRDNIEDLPHPVFSEFLCHFIVFLFCPDFRVQGVVVHDVISMQAPFPGFEIGGCIEVADAEGKEIRDDPLCVLKPEMPVELKPVSRHRDSRFRKAFSRHNTSNL